MGGPTTKPALSTRTALALLSFTVMYTAASPASARMGVAPVVILGDADEELERSIETAVYLELKEREHEYLPAGRLEQRTAGVDRREALEEEFWVAAAEEIAVESILVVRVKVQQGRLALTVKVFHADGSTRTVARQCRRSRAVNLVRKLVGEAIGFADDVDADLAVIEDAVGRDLDRGYIEFQREQGGGVRAYAGYWEGRFEEQHLRGRITAFAIAPLILVAGGAGATGLFVAAHRSGEDDDESDHSYWGGSMEKALLYTLGGVVAAAGVVGSFAAFFGGLNSRDRAETALHRLRLLLLDDEAVASRGVTIGFAPLIGPDGPVGAAAVLRF